MYLYSWMPEILAARREKRKEKQRLQKLANRETEKIELQKMRDEKTHFSQERRTQIREHLKWLDEMNAKIKNIKRNKEESY